MIPLIKTFRADTLSALETQIRNFIGSPLNSVTQIICSEYGFHEPGNAEYSFVIFYLTTPVVPPGSSSQYGSFFGLTAGTGNPGPSDYPGTIAPGTYVPFPQNGPASGILRFDASTFILPTAGTYEVNFKVHTTEPGQLGLNLNLIDIREAVSQDFNPTAGGHLITGSFIITTLFANSQLRVINPFGNATALTITPADGLLTHANSQNITIKKLA